MRYGNREQIMPVLRLRWWLNANWQSKELIAAILAVKAFWKKFGSGKQNQAGPLPVNCVLWGPVQIGGVSGLPWMRGSLKPFARSLLTFIIKG